MKTPITNAYWKLDSFLVDRANEAVKAWNWTTGRTRADLANLMNFGGSGLTGVKYLSVGVIYGTYSLLNYLLNRQADILESSSQEVIDSRVKVRKDTCKTLGPLQTGWGTFSVVALNGEPNSELLGSGIILIGLSNYVMRADYQKPQKDCVRRGLEKLAEAIKPKVLAPEMARYEEAREWE